ncbi:MAG: hypothetical protein KKE86_05260 [Planctomycetes bacterium]|nr:hypothetical protein [Planctomycetota bacterium]MBU4398728.1 hypothetical protein [Planctomycetota bacterium]MCG2684006.1 hypothetical protein [Planctomycetales bacterium]
MDNSAALFESCELGASALTPYPSPNERGEVVEQKKGTVPVSGKGGQSPFSPEVWCHETACVEQPSMIGPGTRIGPYAHVMAGATVGSGCRIGRNVVIAPTAVVGDNVSIGHNVVVEDGVVLEEGVVCAPGVVFATLGMSRGLSQSSGNVQQPNVGGEAAVGEKGTVSLPTAKRIVVRRRASLGTNATILDGVTVHIYAVIGTGAVVASDVPSYAVMIGVPARQEKWLCSCTKGKLNLDPRFSLSAMCPACRLKYRLTSTGAEEYSPEEERRRRKADLYSLERRYVESITPRNR